MEGGLRTELRPMLVGEIVGQFFVPGYQRGYRWGRDEVTRLLDDISESLGRKYFLQPVVAKRRDDGKWELVDGQQRLTTLLLILRYIHEHLPTVHPKYSVEYETRLGSADYLDHPAAEQSQDNIDFFHIFGAFSRIREWFESHDDVTLEAINFYKYLSESVYIIWYEAPADVESTTLFTRLNVGRIPLTDAELVKALLLTRASELKREREIAAQWDTIERDLRVPELWAFVTGRPSQEATHITLLLDTLAVWPKGKQRPLFHTFETLRPMIESAAQDTWNKVVGLHSLIMGWYDNRDLFHKIGYLIARGRTFDELVALSQDCTKREFEARLDTWIGADLSLKASDLAELRYGNTKTAAVLLLMNVETVRSMTLSAERFSFKEHAAQRWSIEHIHAQNAEQLNRATQWVEWLRLHRDALAGLPTISKADRADLTERINTAIGDISAEAFAPLEQELTTLFSLAGESEDVDAIANLALLASDDNSALSNSVFEVKRRSVLDRDHAQRVPQVLHRRRRAADPLLGPARPRRLPRRDATTRRSLPARRGRDLMPGFLTSYTGLFSPPETDAPGVTSIEIPLIQRDYAQGRTDARTSDIRERFLDVLHEALTEGGDVGLDFIYGDVEDGTLRPLDGQQRLTTLFLLHWYLGYRAEQLSERQAWMSFSYATRPTARLFCEQIVTAQPPPDESAPAAWIVDQPWYLYVWRNDPTIQAMLVMIDAIHRRFADCDARSAWQRLIASDAPAISFQLLPIDDMGSGEDIYIKMNSRGKPLTPFENFKALFERAIAWAGDKATEFDHRIDGSWSDILWRLRGYDDIVDDKFLRYFEFITDICQWRAGQLPGGVRLETRALQLFGTAGRPAEESLEFLFNAFNTWAGADIGEEFGQLFATNRADLARNPDRLLLFGTETGADLFDACCRHYGTQRFTYGRTLLLFAVLLDRASPSEEFPRRLRVLRNLIEASESELRPHRLPALVADVQRIVADGSLDEINGFNRAQADDEQAKWAFLRAHPDLATVLFRLEDHPLLRGSLQAFDLDAATFAHRAAAFESLMAAPDGWRDLTGALLAAGNYARRRNDRDLQFGSPSNGEPWRNLLTGTSRANLRPTADALSKVLDAVAAGTAPRVSLRQMQDAFVRSGKATGEFDWRYYLVRYDTMREGASGIYASVGGNMGYLVCMLDRTQMNGRYRDPYLAALAHQAGADAGLPEDATAPVFAGGHVDYYRWMELTRSGAAVRCTLDGWVLRRPEREEFLERFDNVCAEFGIDEQLKLAVPQQVRDGRYVDASDRVQAGARLLRALAAAGL